MDACFECSCPGVQGEVTKRDSDEESVCGRYAMDLASIRSGGFCLMSAEKQQWNVAALPQGRRPLDGRYSPSLLT